MRRLRRAFVSLIATVVLMVGCGIHGCFNLPHLAVQGNPIIDVHVYVGVEFTDRERSNIINGILMWERATSGLVVWHMLPYDPAKPLPTPEGLIDGVEKRSVLFRRATSDDEWVKKWDVDHKPNSILGLCQGDSLKEVTWLWLVEDRLMTSEVETIIAAHEFGHAIGLDHIEDKASTMSRFYNASIKRLTVYDLREFCKKHECNVEVITTTCKSK